MATFYTDSASFNQVQISSSLDISGSVILTGSLNIDGTIIGNQGFTGSLLGTASYAESTPPTFIDNLITVGLPGSNTNYNSIKSAVDSITDASQNNTYAVIVHPGIYIEDTIQMKSWVAVKGESSISTVVSSSNPSASVFIMADQSMIIDMQVQGSTAPGVAAVYYSSPTTPQTNAISYVENVRFGTNYTNAMCVGSGSGNCIMQCSNVKYGGYPFEIGFRVSGSGGSIGRMQLRNVTSTNGGVTGSSDQIFALAEAPGCAFIVNGCMLTRAVGSAAGTGFKVYNGGSLRLTGVNFQRWTRGIWAPQTGSAPSIDAVALNFENCTTDVLIEHTGSTGKISGTDNFLKTIIPATASLYEVNQDPRRITVAKKGGDFTSISASVAWITDSDENNRYVIEVGPGQYFEDEINLVGKPYVSIVGSSIQTTQIFPNTLNQHLIRMGVNNEVSFLTLADAPTGYSALYVDDIGDFAQAHKVSFFDCDTNITVISRTQDTIFYGEYIDFNGIYTYGTYISSSNGSSALANLENYYQFPSGSTNLIANLAIGSNTELDLYTGTMEGEGPDDPGSVAIQIESGADVQVAGFDFPKWNKAIYIPNTGIATSRFNIVGSMIHDSATYDFEIADPNAICRFQGTANHSKISNSSANFYWTFLDAEDGELDITRNLAVTFDDGTHIDASTLIFKGSPMGVMQGGDITISGSLTINVAAGFGYLQDSISTSVYKRIDWSNSTLTLSANSNNYIYINDNEILSAAGTSPNSETNIILGRVVTNNTRIEFIDQSPYNGEHMSNKLSKFNREALGPVFAEGSIVTENVTPFKLDVTQGSYFFSENNFTPSGTSSINFTQYYESASVWARYTSSVVPNNAYASGSALIAMSASYYTKHTVYLVGDGVDEEYFLVINGNQYATLVESENANLPTIPTYFNDGVVPLAAVYVQSGSANITQIQDIRPVIGFRAAGVNASAVHGNLLGLTADDHLQYLRVDGARELTGDLGFGGNDLYNIGYVSASEFKGPLANITTINATSVTASFNGNLTGTAQTASYVAGANVDGNISGNATNITAYTINQNLGTTNQVTFGGVTSSLFGTASWANNAVTASYVQNAISSSFATTASYANVAQTLLGSVVSASYAATASYVQNAISASYANINISAGAASNNLSQLVFSNANNVSFGLNGSTITATAAGGGDINVSAGTTSNNISQLVFSNTNNISFGLDGSTITATYQPTLQSYYENIPVVVGTANTLFSLGGSSNFVQPFILPYDISVSYIRLLMTNNIASTTYGTTANATVALTNAMTWWANIYTAGAGANSRSLQYVTGGTVGMTYQVRGLIGAASNNQTVSQSISFAALGFNTQNTSTVYNITSANQNISTTWMTMVNANRFLDIPFAASLPAGEYWLAVQKSSATTTSGLNIGNATMNNTLYNISQVNISFNLPGNASNASTDGLQPGLGYWSTNVLGSTSNSLALSHISTIVNQPKIPFQMHRFA